MPRVVLAEYFCTDDMTLLFIIRHDFDQPKVYTIERPLAALRNWVQQQATHGVPDEDEYQQEFADFVRPIREWADPGDVLYLIPHDILHYLPLHALKIEEDYLIDRHPIAYAPSATVIQYCQRRRKPNKGNRALVLAYAPEDNPLPHARQQAQSIARRYQATPLIDQAATRAAVFGQLGDAVERERIDVIHFACHGQFKNGLQANLQLADGILTAQDFFGMQMQADLVTLGACESGVNERRPGDELIGFTRSLIYAGTPTVLVGLWRVDELSTSLLMQEFYRKWDNGQGTTKAVALQQAQRYVREMTAQEAIETCDKLVLETVDDNERLLFSADIAQLRFRANDFGGALTAFDTLLKEPKHTEAQAKQWRGMLNRCKWAAKTNRRVEYQRKVFDDIRAWSPFILVGDWK